MLDIIIRDFPVQYPYFKDEETEVQRKGSDLLKTTKGVEGGTEGPASVNQHNFGTKGLSIGFLPHD